MCILLSKLHSTQNPKHVQEYIHIVIEISKLTNLLYLKWTLQPIKLMRNSRKKVERRKNLGHTII